jgi:hypothetical protein
MGRFSWEPRGIVFWKGKWILHSRFTDVVHLHFVWHQFSVNDMLLYYSSGQQQADSHRAHNRSAAHTQTQSVAIQETT